VKFVEVEEIVASGTPAELLAGDENAPHMRIANHPVWRAALAGELPTDRLRELVQRVYPVMLLVLIAIIAFPWLSLALL